MARKSILIGNNLYKVLQFDAPFICIEPWYGRCDCEGYKGELKDRAWENELPGSGIWTASYFIEIEI